jgi:hypothetical protein
VDSRLNGAQNLSGRGGKEKNLALTGTVNSDPLAVQPVASRYIDNAIPIKTFSRRYVVVIRFMRNTYEYFLGQTMYVCMYKGGPKTGPSTATFNDLLALD